MAAKRLGAVGFLIIQGLKLAAPYSFGEKECVRAEIKYIARTNQEHDVLTVCLHFTKVAEANWRITTGIPKQTASTAPWLRVVLIGPW
ncbi:hypothetical protein FEE96_20880 [Parasedimentitalea maritima]|uniref:Uncharacterized protein n=1 Tax=Parasedimentitalea maritima TaxID=2578117 RepID=A0ABY2UP35_9RHOB|nr:hypothetical protein [Zongyanglinia marina]TLP56428.1 hypothetical protein FEE96_20880 [Zongyanglinia marina]